MADMTDTYNDELRELQRRIGEYVKKGLHPAHARNKARKDMREQKSIGSNLHGEE